jgi:hypothetical protein
MAEKSIKGSCLCGKVTYKINGPFKIFQYCYCSRCRKFTGSTHASNLFVPPDQFKWLSGDEMISRFEHPKAKYFATSFCKNCGSSLPWVVKGGKTIIVAAGTLDVDPGIKPMQSIFWESRASWHEETGNLHKYAEFPKQE